MPTDLVEGGLRQVVHEQESPRLHPLLEKPVCCLLHVEHLDVCTTSTTDSQWGADGRAWCDINWLPPGLFSGAVPK